MLYKNQILVFIVSFLIVGFFLLSKPEMGFSGVAPDCCQDTSTSCFDLTPTSPPCDVVDVRPGAICNEGRGRCERVEPIPTLNQWGMIIMAGVLGLFAVIGLFVMRRRNVVMPSN